MTLGANTLKSLLSKTLFVAMVAWFSVSTAIVYAADIQPGQQIFCTFSNNKTGMNRYNLNLNKQFKAYLVNDKRKIALTFNRAVDSQRLLWNIPANAELGNYTFKVVKKQKKNRKQYFNCGKPKDYRLTNTPSNIAITETTDGTLITNIEGISQSPSSAGSTTYAGYVQNITPLLIEGGVTGYGTYSGVEVRTFSLTPALNDNAIENDITINSGSLQVNGGSIGATYSQNYTGIHLNLGGNINVSGSLIIQESQLDENIEVILSGNHLGDLILNASVLSKCQTGLKENYWDFATFIAQSGGSTPICSSYDEYKNYISKSVTDVVAACGLNISDNTDIVVNGLSMRDTVKALQQMQADAALIAGCDTPSQ
jgi:hypothetical protein